MTTPTSLRTKAKATGWYASHHLKGRASKRLMKVARALRREARQIGDKK